MAIHHIGSTSVPGLKAKPIIDIMPVVKDIVAVDSVNEQMAELGYEAMGELGIPGRRYFRKGGDNRTHQVHAYQADNQPVIDRHLALRDYLRTHPEAAKQYGELKASLAQQFPQDIQSYMDGKDRFVKDLEKKALAWYPSRGAGTRGNPFASPFQGYLIRDHLTNRHIIVGEHSYYSGFYHGKHFEDNVWYLNPDNDNEDKLIIGRFCSIGTGAIFIMSGNQGHRFDWISTYPFHGFPEADWGDTQDGYLSKGNTVVGNDVWIGAEAMIMPGIHIGDGAVIGTRAVVTKDVEPYAIVAGNPAKVIRKRFSESDISRLLEIQWWSWPEEKIRQQMHFLCSGDIHGLYQA